MMKKIQLQTAILGSDGCFRNFGISPTTSMLYGKKPEDIINVKIEIAEDQTICSNDEDVEGEHYWGWIDEDKEEFSTMIWKTRHQLDMCFPSGVDHSEKIGRGKSYKLIITKIDQYES